MIQNDYHLIRVVLHVNFNQFLLICVRLTKFIILLIKQVELNIFHTDLKKKTKLFKKGTENEQFAKVLFFWCFHWIHHCCYAAYIRLSSMIDYSELLSLKQICHVKIKRLSPGDFKMPIKENRRGNVLIFFSFFFSYPVLAKSNSWVILHCF